MESIFDMVTAQAIAAYYEALESNRIPFLGEVLFPADKRAGLRLDWIKGYDSLPVMLTPSAFDTKPTLRDRGGAIMESTKMPFFREAMRLGEEDRQQLLMFLQMNNNQYARQLITKIYDDTKTLIDGALLVPEVMRMKLITDGAFTMSSPDDSGVYVNYNYDYDPNDTWTDENNTTLTTTDKWSDHTNSNPISDILDVKRDAQRKGKVLTRAICGYQTWLDISQNAKIKLGINPIASTAANVVLTDAQIKTYVESMCGIRIQIYDKMYRDVNKTDQFFYPTRGYFTLLTNDTLGRTWFGTTPEEADLMSGNTLAQVAIVNTGIAVATEKIALPVNIINWVSEIVLPSFENMGNVYNLKY